MFLEPFKSIPSTYKHTKNHINGHFSGNPRLAGCSLYSQFPIIFILSILMGLATTLQMILDTIPTGLFSLSH